MNINDVIEAMIKPSSGVSPGNSKPFNSNQPSKPSNPSIPSNGKPFDTDNSAPTDPSKSINMVTGKDGKTLQGLTPQDQAKVSNVLGTNTLNKLTADGKDVMPDIMKMAKDKGFDIMMRDEKTNEAGMPSSVIKHKQKYSNMTDDEKRKAFAGKSIEVLKAMARRHGYGPNSDVYSKYYDGETTDHVQHNTTITETINSDIDRIRDLSGLVKI